MKARQPEPEPSFGTEVAAYRCMRLTDARKRGTFKIGAMSKTKLTVTALAFVGALLLSGCAGPRLKNQIGFGIWAADHELWDEAIFRWKKVLDHDPQSAAAHNNLAVAFEKKGLWEEARKEYEAALKVAPGNSWIKLNFKNFKDNLEPGKSDKKDKPAQDEKE
jgi:tetratricopeptide (TPR) repeat protein